MLVIAALLAAAPTSSSELPRVEWPAPAATEARLITVPGRIYFTLANAKERTLASVFFLVVDAPAGAVVDPRALRIDYLAKGRVVRSEVHQTAMLAPLDLTAFPPARVYSAALAATRAFPHAYRLTLTAPATLPFDTVRLSLDARVGGRTRTLVLTADAAQYAQRTHLVFPFRGPGIISVGGALASGHRNRSGLYAIDAIGLAENYAPLRPNIDDSKPPSYAGWSREIIAPAAGRIVFARNDHVDQPVNDTSNPAYFLPQYRNGGDPGNYVVIDHGNGEFSMIAHMQRGSVKVAAGDTVAQGQTIGLLGNSGDTTGPHVHYQLQNGPDWEYADALPFAFDNVGDITRGSYFNAKPAPARP